MTLDCSVYWCKVTILIGKAKCCFALGGRHGEQIDSQTHIHAHKHPHSHTLAPTQTHIDTPTNPHPTYIHTHIHTYTHPHTSTQTHTHTYTHTNMHERMHSYSLGISLGIFALSLQVVSGAGLHAAGAVWPVHVQVHSPQRPADGCRGSSQR